MHKTFVSVASCILSRNSSVSRMAFCLQACVRGNKDMSDEQILRRKISQELKLDAWESKYRPRHPQTWLYNLLHVHIYKMATWETWLHICRVYRWMIWGFIYSMHYCWRYLLPFLCPTFETYVMRFLKRWIFYITAYVEWPVPMRFLWLEPNNMSLM